MVFWGRRHNYYLDMGRIHTQSLSENVSSQRRSEVMRVLVFAKQNFYGEP